MLEPPWRGGSNVYPQSIFWSIPHFNYIIVGCMGVNIICTFYRDGLQIISSSVDYFDGVDAKKITAFNA